MATQVQARRSLVGLVEVIGILLVIAALSAITLIPKTHTQVIGGGFGLPEGYTVDEQGNVLDESGNVVGTVDSFRRGGGAAGAAGTTGTAAGRSGRRGGVAGGTGGSGSGSGSGNLACAAGRNGGATDEGVSATSIKVGATVVESGAGSSFLGEVKWGIRAAINPVNNAGGICGRRIDLDKQLKDDGWSATLGNDYIKSLVEGDKVFSLVVNPSSEGLRVASQSGYLRGKGIPVVGTDGMLASQYTDPVIFPVSTATISAMHILAHFGNEEVKAKGNSFAPVIVYDAGYRFGPEGAHAFNQAVYRLTGKWLRDGYTPDSNPECSSSHRLCGLTRKASYPTEKQNIQNACGGGGNFGKPCNFVVLLLEPDLALQWMNDGGLYKPTEVPWMAGGTAGPQPLFNKSFAERCQDKCNGMMLWSSYVPPIGGFANAPAVSTFTQELSRVKADADRTNAFVEGGYLGAKLFIEALKKVGPKLTRPALLTELNRMTLDTGLSKPLGWTAVDRSSNPAGHFANRCMLAFEISYTQGAFHGFGQRQGWTDWVCDPWAGQDVPDSEW